MKAAFHKKPELKALDGVAFIDGKAINLEKIRIDNPIASGAHGSVFEGFDTGLERTVAVKIWYKTGEKVREGAIGEVRKLASLKHPLFVTVYQMDVVNTTPYATMEFLSGPSIKEWLKKNNFDRSAGESLFNHILNHQKGIQQRCNFWFLYSGGLRYLYSQGILHGDPHVGNVIVFEDEIGTLKHLLKHHILKASDLLSIRILDLGTSLFRDNPNQMAVRESRVLYETAQKLFPDFNVKTIMNIDIELEPKEMLRVLDAYAEFVLEMSSLPRMMQVDFDFLEHSLPQLLGWCPFFNYETVREILSSLFNTQIADALICDALCQMQTRRTDQSRDAYSNFMQTARLASADNVHKLMELSKQLRSEDWDLEPDA